jgi:hypothetical protein
MRELFNGIAWIFLAIGFVALGADAYWTWKAHHLAFQPVGFYLDLAADDWLASLRDWAADRSHKTERVVTKLLSLPVWAPAFAVGIPLGFLTRERR